jgi:hypothetical protein
LQELFKTKFKATATESLISGENLRPHYNFEDGQWQAHELPQGIQRRMAGHHSRLPAKPMPPPSPPHTPGSPPTVTRDAGESGVVAANVRRKTAEDVYNINRLIDKLTKGIADAEKAPKSTRTAEDQRTKGSRPAQAERFLVRIRAEPCVPREVIDLLKSVLSGNRDMCGRHCETTASWVSRLYPAPTGDDAMRVKFLRLCNLYCPLLNWTSDRNTFSLFRR